MSTFKYLFTDVFFFGLIQKKVPQSLKVCGLSFLNNWEMNMANTCHIPSNAIWLHHRPYVDQSRAG